MKTYSQNTIEIDPSQIKSFADKILNRTNKKPTHYMDPSFLPCGSVEVESLFSVCSDIWTDRRLSTTPEHIESYMFLKMNKHLWNENLVAKVIGEAQNEEIEEENDSLST